MRLIALAFATLLALVAGTAIAGCSGHCEDGYTWSSESNSCVPKTVSS
jgi:hypothetical protein